MTKANFYFIFFCVHSVVAMEVAQLDNQMPISGTQKLASFLYAFMNRSLEISDKEIKYPFYCNEFLKQPIYIKKPIAKITHYFDCAEEMNKGGWYSVSRTDCLSSSIERFIFKNFKLFFNDSDLPDSYDEFKKDSANLKIALEALADKKKFDATLPDLENATELTHEEALKVDASSWVHNMTTSERHYLYDDQKKQRKNLKKVISKIRHTSKEAVVRNEALALMIREIKKNRQTVKESVTTEFDKNTYFNNPLFLNDFLKSDNKEK